MLVFARCGNFGANEHKVVNTASFGLQKEEPQPAGQPAPGGGKSWWKGRQEVFIGGWELVDNNGWSYLYPPLVRRFKPENYPHRPLYKHVENWLT